MAQVTPDQLVRQWFEEVWNEGREDAIDRLMAPDVLVHGLSGPHGVSVIRGPQEFKPFFRTMRAALSNLQVHVIRTVVQDDCVAAHCHVVAVHSGEALGGPATGRPVNFWGMTIVRVRDGRLVEGWNCFDFLAMYQQIGWVNKPVVP